ncbi:MAG: shikimate dehydrogenase [Candidatus Omnitrophica bacterium]|nr:shikimate dehydrogenase [Candidatus Omnitrophota bacterium]MBL7151694.1 shikimate dehydrogenase [Candidatus Omnitrophota bacterium]
MSPKAIYGLIGYPVEHSLSKKMQEAAFAACGIDAEYRLIPVKPEQLQDFLSKNLAVADLGGNQIALKDLSGFNITIPHKVEAKRILQENFPPAGIGLSALEYYYLQLTGAVNTVKKEAETLRYWNTDAGGILRALSEDLKFTETKGKSVLLLGCGGAGRAVVAALSWKDLGIEKIYIYENNEQAAAAAKKHFLSFSQAGFQKEKLAFIDKDSLSESIKKARLLVNATPVGMKDDAASVIDKSLLSLNKNLSVYEVVYNRKTQLIKDAESLGLPVCGGLGMLLFQGVYAFKYWTGSWPDAGLMRRALEEGVGTL